MAKKLLNEATVRRFQSLANIRPINEMSSYKRDDEEEKMEEMREDLVESQERAFEERQRGFEKDVYGLEADATGDFREWLEGVLGATSPKNSPAQS